jgi:hypothetical protein
LRGLEVKVKMSQRVKNRKKDAIKIDQLVLHHARH